MKRNVAIPSGILYLTNNPRVNVFRNINSKSWFKFGFLIKNSLNSYFNMSKINHNSLNADIINFSLFNFLSDSCYILRSLPYLSRPKATSAFELDFSVSTYSSQFYYYDLRKRSQFFWIANQNFFQSFDFLISSFEQPIFKNTSIID